MMLNHPGSSKALLNEENPETTNRGLCRLSLRPRPCPMQCPEILLAGMNQDNSTYPTKEKRPAARSAESRRIMCKFLVRMEEGDRKD